MRVLVTGHKGFIGSVMVPFLRAAGHDIVGMDADYYRDCSFVGTPAEVPSIQRDIRDAKPSDLAGFDAVVHLAALSNDPLGDLDPELTYDINHRATIHLAKLARQAKVPRFLFSDFPLGNSAGKPHDLDSQAFTLELALRLLESAPGPQTSVQSPLRWSADASWKRDYNNVATLSADELARRRREFDAQKEIARGIRESAA